MKFIFNILTCRISIIIILAFKTIIALFFILALILPIIISNTDRFASLILVLLLSLSMLNDFVHIRASDRTKKYWLITQLIYILILVSPFLLVRIFSDITHLKREDNIKIFSFYCFLLFGVTILSIFIYIGYNRPQIWNKNKDSA